jgi:hypothetical protein
MENMSQSNELEEIEVELDNTLSINPTPDQPINTVSPAVSEAGDGSVSVTSENPLYKRKERQKTAKVWNNFDSITLSGGVKKSQCRWCKRFFAVEKSSTTSTLNKQLTSCARFIEHNSSKKQKKLSFEPSSEYDGVKSLVAFSYKESKVREMAAHMVLFHEYSFNMMEHKLFNKFMRICTTHWKKNKSCNS